MKKHILFSALIISALLYSCSEEPYYPCTNCITREFTDTMQIRMPLDTMRLYIYQMESDTGLTVVVNDNLHDSLLVTAKIKGTNLSKDTSIAYKNFSIKDDTIVANFEYHAYITKKQKSPTPLLSPIPERFWVVSAIIEIPKGKILIVE
jgi:hypothetical protein